MFYMINIFYYIFFILWPQDQGRYEKAGVAIRCVLCTFTVTRNLAMHLVRSPADRRKRRKPRARIF